MSKKSALMLLGLISISLFQVTKPEFKFDWTAKTVIALAPFMYYLHYKEPKMDPEFKYTLDVDSKKFFTQKNFWHIFDQLIIGQRLKLKSEKLGERKIKFAPKDCYPHGFLGLLDCYVVGTGARAAKALLTLHSALIAADLKGFLSALKS